MKNMHNEEVRVLTENAEKEICTIEEDVKMKVLGQGFYNEDRYNFLKRKNKEIEDIRERLSLKIKKIKENASRDSSRYGWITLWKNREHKENRKITIKKNLETK